MDVQEDTPRTSSDPKPTTEPEAPPKPESGSYPDQIPGGRYHIVDRLSTSAIGAVYKALDTVLDRPVAVKCVRLDTPLADQSSDELRERFVREARVAAKLQHPNIVTIHDIVATPDRGYIIMEFIEGRTLESLIESEGRLPLSTAIKILGQLSSALDYAHERNVVHRDVKPANILVSPSMYVWVTDFGIAKSELSTNLTMAGGVLGTPDYMSPEQAKGEDVDARSDLFSLGCILFEAAVGDKPFRSPSLTGVLLSIINDEPVFPLNWRTLGLPTELKPILHHSLEKERDKRYASGAALMEALLAIPASSVEAADIAAGATPPSKIDPSSAGPPSETAEVGTKAADEPGSEAMAAEEPTADEAGEVDEVTPAEASEDHVEQPPETSAAPTTEARTEVGDAPAETEPPDGDEASPGDENGAEDAAETAAVDSEVGAPASEPAGAEEREADHDEAEASAETGADEPGADTNAAEPEASEASAEPESEVDPGEDDLDINIGAREAPPAITAEQIQALKDETQVLHLSPTLSGELQDVEISPEEGFLLSRIDGAFRPNDIISVSPMAEADTVRALLDFLGKGLIRLGGVTREPVAPKPEPPPEPGNGPDPEIAAEVDRLLALADAGDYPSLLGLEVDAAEGKRKSAYLKIVAKFHPDKFSGADDEFRDKLSRLCSSASEAAADYEQCEAVKKAKEAEAAPATNGGPRSSNGGGSAGFDKRRHARELYDRALTAYDRADFWDAIQLGRQAIEVDNGVAEFYGLLARALMQNKKWRKEAADNFLKASQLDPNNVDFIGMLGAIYQSEGLTTRASSLLERARTLDPDYEFPDLDGPDVVAE